MPEDAGGTTTREVGGTMRWRTLARTGAAVAATAVAGGLASSDVRSTWYARLDNITNRLAYSATSILTTTVYPAAPLPGRSLKVGLRVTF